MYFSLKDEAAQVRCAMFRGKNLHLRFTPKNGMRILVRAKVTLYEARGDFQIIVEHMEESGIGALQRAFEDLKDKLGREGLFDQRHKIPLPDLPKRIGIITSPTGAAIHDLKSVLKRRFAAIPLLIYPTQVQGATAAAEIAEAIRLADARKDCDVLIVARGGGSLEDLWSFNEEVVARAIHDCELPIISAVGHEVDFTIADFVADLRAPTPSAAAEMVTPDSDELQITLSRQLAQLQIHVKHQLRHARQQCGALDRRLQQLNPARRLQQQSQRIDELEQQLLRTHKARITLLQARVKQLHSQLQQHSPIYQLRSQQQHCVDLGRRLQRQMTVLQERRRQRLATSSRALDAISPLATLHRGYAIVETPDNGRVVREASQVAAGDTIRTRLGQGQLLCTVNKVESNS